MFTINKFKNKFNINDEMKIHNYVGVGFGSRLCTHSVGVNAFCLKKKTVLLQHPNMEKVRKNRLLTITVKVTVVQKTWKLQNQIFNLQGWEI